MEELASKKHTFTLIISVDYQQSKLIPYWGSSAQPGSTYYLQKVSHDVFGLVDHRDGQQHTTLFDERIGPKNTDHTISIIQSYIDKVTALHPWIRRVLLFLDNAANTNKNRYLFSWGMELVSQRTLDYVRFCFMLPGHTKFAPDRLFAQVSNSYNCHDVFTISELKDICDLHAHTTIEDGASVLQWREALRVKYSNLSGTRKYHDFLVARSYDQSVLMKVRESCCSGSFSRSPLKVTDPSVAGVPTDNYKETQFRDLSTEKYENMKLMYNQFVSPERHPDYLPPFVSVINTTSRSSNTSSSNSVPPPAKRPRKQSTRSVPQIRPPSRISPSPALLAQSLAELFYPAHKPPHSRRRLILIPQSKYYLKPLGCLPLRCLQRTRTAASTMDTLATSRKRLASSLLNAKARQLTANVVSISPPRARRCPALGPHPPPTMTSCPEGRA